MVSGSVAVFVFIALVLIIAIAVTYPKWKGWKEDIQNIRNEKKELKRILNQKLPGITSIPPMPRVRTKGRYRSDSFPLTIDNLNRYKDPCPPGEEPQRIHASGKSAKRCANPDCRKPLGHHRLNIHLTRSNDGWTTTNDKKQYCCWECVPPEVKQDVELSISDAENTTRKALQDVDKTFQDLTDDMKRVSSDLKRSGDEMIKDLTDLFTKY